MAQNRLDQLYKTAVERYNAGDLVGAEKLARKVAKKASKNANAINLLAVIVQHLGKIPEAIKLFERVCQLAPDQLQSYINLGNALRGSGQSGAARRAYEMALERDPTFVAAKLNLGTVLQESGNYSDALEQFSAAVDLSPDYQPAHYNLGICLRDMRRFDEALTALARAIELKPSDAGSYLERANVLSDLGRDEEAIDDIQIALRLKPGWPDAFGNWASFLTNLDRHDEALKKFDRSLELDPTNMTNVVNKGLACLAMGDLERGWPAYLKRAESAAPFYTKFEYDLPHWSGGDISGQRVLVWTEQALGDQILYAGLMEEFAAQAGHVTWTCPTKVVELFRRSFQHLKNVNVTGESVADLELSEFDCHASMIDLAAAFRPSLSAFPKPKAYLNPDGDAVAQIRTSLRDRFGADTKFVGLSWASKNPLIGDGKSIPPNDLESLVNIPGIQFINVQYGPAAENLGVFAAHMGDKIHTVEGVDLNGALQDSLNLLAALDLFITCSNTTAHLSAAAGLPTWVLVPAGKARIWYWFLHGTDSPWYPNARLYRHNLGESWGAAISRIAESIKEVL